MRSIVTLLCALFFFPAAALGKPLYVSGYREVMVRTGPSLENKILAILKTGQEVSLVGEEGDYYSVTLPNGIKGYVLKNYMTEQVPAEARLQEIEQKTQQRIKELETQTQEQAKELIILREQRGRLEAAKQQAEAAAQQQTDLASRLQSQQSASASESQQRWFITGAGVLLTGLVLGWIWGATGRRNRRNGLSLSRF
ncbi:MAG: TIGR04211 family SH3 domain-containing protein [Deltaproteobacteria bacterium]|nr:TIGR04211 family SH3 domain-containing protein [Deltaproteobacteria bacterium]